jgi:hypothetical protein
VPGGGARGEVPRQGLLEGAVPHAGGVQHQIPHRRRERPTGGVLDQGLDDLVAAAGVEEAGAGPRQSATVDQGDADRRDRQKAQCVCKIGVERGSARRPELETAL